MSLKSIFAAWNLGKKIPEWSLAALVGGLAALLLFGKGCTTKTIHTKETVEHFETVEHLDSIIRTVRVPHYVRVPEYKTVVVDSTHDCWGSVDMVIGNDTLRIDSANSCKGIYRGVLLTSPVDSALLVSLESLKGEVANDVPVLSLPAVSDFGYRVDARFGASLVGGTVIGADARIWLGRFGAFLNPRLVIPDFKKSSLDGGLSYRLF